MQATFEFSLQAPKLINASKKYLINSINLLLLHLKVFQDFHI